MTRIVVTIQSRGELDIEIEPRLADMLELRLDLDPGLLDVIEALDFPVLATVRSLGEGGAFGGTPGEAAELLERALDCGAELCDLELRRDDPARFPPGRTVLSCHDFGRPSLAADPEQLRAMIDELVAPGPAVAKLACAISSGHELSCLLAGYDQQSQAAPTQLALIGMGAQGAASRILAARFGAPMTWCAAPGSPAVAPGQIDAREMVEGYNARDIQPGCRVFAVVGHPVSHSASPTFHNATMSLPRHGDGEPRDVYVPLDLPDLEALPTLGTQLGLAGASVAMPHKTQIAAVMDAVLTGEQGGGGVNTLWRDPAGEQWLAGSTDRQGIRSALRCANFELTGARVAILGAGGAARAALATVLEQGAEATIVARDARRGAALATDFPETRLGPWPSSDPSEAGPADEADLVINATPLGMTPDTGTMPCAPHAFGARAVLFDMVYSPVWTRWLAAARLSGQRVVLGLSMFVWQALAQQQLWFGRQGDDMLGRRALLERLPSGHPTLWLAGARGSGKSTVGRRLAQEIRVPFVDLDECIERRGGMPCGRLLAESGEEVFRRVESSCVERDVLARRGEPLVVATGGGTVLKHADVMATNGIGVYLRAAPKTLAGRVEADRHARGEARPPLYPGLNPVAEAERVLQDREPAYRRACSLEIATDHLREEDVVPKIRALLGSPCWSEGPSADPVTEPR